MDTAQSQHDVISAGTVQILPNNELEKKLTKKKKLRVKFGMDPTSPDLHLGHAVALSKLKQFQDLGHDVILLIGDFTARIGDPTGRSKTRPPLTEKQIAENTRTYLDQVSKVLDTDNLEVRYNSEWLDKLSIKDMVNLCSKVTLARITERDDFAKRIQANQPVRFHELLYPLFQGYDSVALKSDIELGGTDQTFNLLMGRALQEQMEQDPQVIVTMPLLEGLDGHEKMSKSLGNAIGLAEPSDQAFGKLMSISDELMWRYLLLLAGKTEHEISILQEKVAAQTMHPMELKKDMAHAIVTRFWGKEEADKALQVFEQMFQKHDFSNAKKVTLVDSSSPIWIVDLLKELGAINSSSEARRLIQGSAVSIDGKKVTDFKAKIKVKSGTIVKVGKHRIYKVG